ncbi:MAG: TM0106 family RecB-like putative nuclease [Pseudolysinimonas sp.]
MFVRDGSVFYSASDLTNAVKCEWALMRKLDAKLGRIEAADEIDDPMLARAGILGGEHEARAYEAYVAEFGEWHPGGAGGVASIEKPEPSTDPVALTAAQDATVASLRGGADVVFQATFFDGSPADGGFVGFADFLIKTGDVYEVYDTKLARKARITALLQLAAYAGQLERLGIPLGPDVHLLLGDGPRSTHRRVDIEPVFDDRMERLRWMLDERMAATEAISWGDAGYAACGRCAECAVQVAATDDVLQVAGMRVTQRTRLAEAGIHTVSQLAASTADVAGIGAAALTKLRAQARMQRDAPQVGLNYEVHDAIGLAALPAPDPGDVFFDFEGDPLWNDGDPAVWGLEYLFGVIEVGDGSVHGHFKPFWAHTRAQEKEALLGFLEYVRDRRLAHPGMHIYHYADYERSHLQALCARHGVGEAILDDLLREHVLVDLYPLVKRSIRVSSASYGLKKLEPLYMGAELRESDVTDGAGSIVAYVDYTLLVAAGEAAEAARQLAEIADYNRYDCVSTLRLWDWLLARADEHSIPRRGDVDPEPGAGDAALERDEDIVRDALYAQIEGVPAGSRSGDQNAIALAAAAIEYHRREDKTYWWEHFNRHIAPIDEWADQRGVFVVDEGGAEVVTAWNRPDGRRMDSRVLRLRGRLAAGSRFAPGDRPHVMYDEPLPPACTPAPRGERSEHARSSILEVTLDGEFAEVLLTESTGMGNDPWHELPLALTPPAPIPTSAQRRAILDWGRAIADRLPTLPGEASLDLLRRIPPRMRSGTLAPVGDDTAAAIVDSLLRLDGSYLAVQGPPGSGKTFVGGLVIGKLVRRGWRVGVVAQSHEVVENLLRRVLAGGAPAERVAKRAPSSGYAAAVDWTVLGTSDEVAGFVSGHREVGYVLGGTAWDFSNPAKVPRGELDLLVVDEAGQFSLANAIAVGVSARNLLLLGDPQQLPQVSQGLHPEHVDMSALGWLSDGHDVLPDELGYFLAESWRMHPALCAAVSDLAYEGRLRSREPETLQRRLDGIEPGLHPVPVSHDGDAVESLAEAEAVVELVQRHLGLAWTDPELGRVDDALRPSDIIVVAPYNAQVQLIRRLLDEAGLVETPVGTVDRFQGQEAAIAIVSLTASSADDVPRGLSFLLLRNRLNVAISRAKWAAYLVHSPALRHHLPHSAEGLAELSAFIRLTA